MKSATPPVHDDGRVSRRLGAMRRIQQVALQLFESKGLSAVSVEEVAAHAKVGVASVYRNFGSKEGLVLWDEYDPALLAGITARLETHAPLIAVRDAVLAELAVVYQRDRQRILRRTRLMFSEPSLLAANAAQQDAFRAALVSLFARRRSTLQAEVLASVAIGVLDACVREWTRRNGTTALSRIITDAFEIAPRGDSPQRRPNARSSKVGGRT